MITECRNVACRLIMKAKALWQILAHLDAGSPDRLAQQKLQIPEHANNRTSPSWLFDTHLSVRDRLTAHCPDASLVTPSPT